MVALFFAGLENESETIRVTTSTSTTVVSDQYASIANVSSKGSGAVAVDGKTGGVFNMNGGYISDNANTSQMDSIGGGGVYLFDSSTYIERDAITKSGTTYPVYYDVVVPKEDFVEGIFGEDTSYPTNITGGVFNMYGGTISDNTSTGQDGGGVFVGAYSTFNMTGGEISDNTAENGGGIGVYYGEVNISDDANISGDTTISNNTATNGAGVYSYYGEVKISGGTIEENEATTGGGVYSYYGKATISGGTISNNTATTNGGGVYSSYGETTISGGTISNNKAATNGGGVYSSNDELVISGGSITYNTATTGGGVYAYNGEANISGGDISYNTTTEQVGRGGGVYLENCETDISGGVTISNNEAGYGGGGVYARNGTITIGTSTIEKNTATTYGGGVYIHTNAVGYIENGAVINTNKSTNHGGGVCVYEGTAYMSGGEITDNIANAGYGGGIELYNSTLTISGGKISGNDAHTYSGVDLYGSKLIISGNPIISGNDGSNVGVSSGSISISGELTSGADIGLYYSGNLASASSDYTISTTDELYITADESGYKYALNDAGTAITRQSLESYEIEIDQTSGHSDYYTTAYSTNTCTELSGAQPIIGTEVIGGTQYYIIASGIDSDGIITGIDKAVSVLTTGNYYLAADLTPAKTITIESGQTVSLCLNGHDIDANNGAFSVITVYGTFNLYDCAENQGSITGGNATYGGGINGVDNSSKINIYGGNITENKASSAGGGIYSSGMVYIYGGTISENSANSGGGIFATSTLSIEQQSGYSRTINITGNTATSAGGGIYCSGTNTYLYAGTISNNTAGTNGGGIYSTGSIFKISNAPVVTDNKVVSDETTTVNNLYLFSNRVATIGTLSEGASIGITKQGGTGQVVQIGTADVSKYFSSDNSDYSVSASGEYLYLAIDITEETVTDKNGDVVNEQTTLAQSTTYNGKAQAPTVDLAINGSSITAEIEWFTDADCKSAVGSDGMINAGTYYGKISGSGIYTGTVESRYEFTINKEAVQIILSESTATYNGTVQEPTITVKGVSSNEVLSASQYTITWDKSGFIDAGTYPLTAISTTNTNFEGIAATYDTDNKVIAIKTYIINQKSMLSSDISVSNKGDEYTIDSASDISIIVTENSSAMDTDDYTITWQYTSSFASGATLNDYNATGKFDTNGVYVATIAGKGNYKDSVKLTFKNIGDQTMPLLSIYGSYSNNSGTALANKYFSQWHGAGQTFVFYAKDDYSGDGNVNVVGMDHATLTINASGVAEQTFEFTKSEIGEGYLDIATGTIYLQYSRVVSDEDSTLVYYYKNASDSSDETEYTEDDIDNSIAFETEVVVSSSAGDTEILTTLTFNPESVTIYNISCSATDANGNTSTTFSYNSTDVSAVTLSIDPRVDLFNGYYEDIVDGFYGDGYYDSLDEDDDLNEYVDKMVEYFKGLTYDDLSNDKVYANVSNVLEAYNYFEGRTTARQQRIAGVDFADGVTASNAVSYANYKNLMTIYNAIDTEEVADYVNNNNLAQALKYAKEAADTAYKNAEYAVNNSLSDSELESAIEALETAIEALETAYKNTLVENADSVIEMDEAIKSALAILIGKDTNDEYASDDIDQYITDIQDYITAKSLVATLEATPSSYSQLSNIISAWGGMDDNESLATGATQQDIAQIFRTASPTFEILIAETESPDTYSYTEIQEDIYEYEAAISAVQTAISENEGNWDTGIRSAIEVLTDEYLDYATDSAGGVNNSFRIGDYNYSGDYLTEDTIKFLLVTTVGTIEEWIENIEAIVNVEELIDVAIASVNNHSDYEDDDTDHTKIPSDDKDTTKNKDLFIYNEGYVDGLEIKEYLIDTVYVATAYEDYVSALAAYSAIEEDYSALIGGISNLGTVAKEIKIDAPDEVTVAETFLDVSAKYMAIEKMAIEEGDADKYTSDEIADSIIVNKLIASLDYSTSTVYDILYVDYLYDNLGNAQDLIGATNTAKLATYMALAGEVYDGDFESTQSGGVIDEDNIAFDGYHGQDDYASDYIVGKIYNLASFEYNSGDLTDEEATAMIQEINQEIVQIIYGKTSVVEYEFDLSESIDRYSQSFFNIHHIFPVGSDFYYVHDEYRSEAGTYAGFWDFGSEVTLNYNEDTYDFYYTTYSDTLTDAQQLIMNSVGTEYDYLLSLFTRLMEAHIAANNLPDDVLGDCEGEDHTVEEHYEDVEIAKMALERLSTDERRLLGEDLDIINAQYEALLEHMTTEDNHGITYSAQGENSEGVSVFGLATQVDLSVLTDYDKGVDNLAVYVVADKYPEFDAVTISDKSTFSGTNVLTAYNIKLVAQTDSETEEIQPSADKKVVVIIPIPNDTLFSSMTLYHIEDTGVNAGAINEITDKTYFIQDGQAYLSFTTTSFSDFVLLGDIDPDYVEPEEEEIIKTSSGGSGTVLDTHDPVISEEDGNVTITDANLASVTVNGEEVDIDGNNAGIDLNEYPNGTYEVTATDKYGRTTSITVVIANDTTVEESTTTPTIVPDITPSTTDDESEEGVNWIWILPIIAIILVVATLWLFVVWKRKKDEEEEDEIIVSKKN